MTSGKAQKNDAAQHRTLHGELMCISNLLRRSANASGVKKDVDRVTNMHGFIIGFLYKNRNRDIFQKDIEEAFSYRRSTASAVIGLMEEKGFIERCSVPYDARLKKLVLTERALEIVSAIDNDVCRTEAQMREGISDDELERFFVVLDKIRKNLEKAPVCRPTASKEENV